MDYINCTGSEFRLWDCNYFTHYYGCSHASDVGISCLPGKSCDRCLWITVHIVYLARLVCSHVLYLALCQDGQIRLTGSQSDRSGRIEVCFNRRWGTVANHYWDYPEAIVVCRELGFAESGNIVALLYILNYTCWKEYSIIGSTYRFGRGGGPIYLTQFQCSGHESRLLDCTFSNDTSSHTHYEDAGVLCYPGMLTAGIAMTPHVLIGDFYAYISFLSGWTGEINGRWNIVGRSSWSVSQSEVGDCE